MDRTAWIVVTLCSIALIYLFQKNAADVAEQRRIAAEQAAQQPEEEDPNADADEGNAAPEAEDGAPAPPPVVADPNVPVLPPEQLRLVTSEAVFQFNQVGGGIETVTLGNHRAFPSGEIVLNQNGKAPIGAFARRDRLVAQPITYSASPSADGKTMVFKGLNPNTKIEITKTYATTDDPYTLRLKIDLTNKSDVNHSSSDYYLHTGALEYLHKKEMPLYLSYNWCDDGEAEKEAVNWFKGGGIIFRRPPTDLLEASGSMLQWAGASNQFYTSLIAPLKPGSGSAWGARTPITLADNPDAPDDTYHALYGAIAMPEVILPNEASASYEFQIYTGPRELKRLESLGHDLHKVMHYDDMPLFGGMFGLIPLLSTSLLKLMIWLASLVHNWGIAILIITCLIRIVIWPLHAKSTTTMKRMAKLAPIMTELKEKYADDPQKMQQETMSLYRDYGINPLGGCLPVFLQLPIFLSFYKMLQSAVELRDQEFLWVKDLAMPDAIYHFQSFSLFGVSSINLMPLLMAATMILQMKIGPKAGDKMQQRIFMFMPLIFLFICYNFASALALYWTGQNIFSIGQTWLMNRRPEPELVKRPRKPRMTLQDMQKAQQQAGKAKKKKGKKRPPRTGG